MNQRRFSPQLQQEQISRKQIEERFLVFGWIPMEPRPDVGEDFIIHIYLDGRATGVTFHVQAKSVTNISERKRGDVLLYTFKPNDLKHWEGFSTPVVLTVWDIILREGRWTLVVDVIAALDKDRPRWRENKTGVTVRIPWDNTFADQSLIRLKQVIGRHFYPQISGGRSPEIKGLFRFSQTPEDQEMLEAFERHVKEGEPVTLRGRVIEELSFPEWWERWFGERNPDSLELQLGPTTSEIVLPASIAVISNEGMTESVSNIEFRVLRKGTEVARLSNEHQSTPLQFSLEIRGQEISLQGSLSNYGFGHSVDEMRNILGFLQAIANGGKVRLMLTIPEHQTSLPLEMTAEPQAEAGPEPHLIDLVNKLYMIQKKTGQFFQIPEQGFLIEDITAIYEMYQILEVGSTTRTNATATFGVKGEALQMMLEVHRQDKPIYLQETGDDSFVELFGTKIATGPMIRDIVGFIEMPVSVLEEAISELSKDQFLSIKLVRATVTESFKDWMPARPS
jgi:hypothetical protein